MAFFSIKNVRIGRLGVAQAHRHFIPGQIWHTPVKQMPKQFHRVNYASGYAFGFDPTSRCHKREFLRFAKDRHRWLQWLYQARRRYWFGKPGGQKRLPLAMNLLLDL
jgi:hypothetical protein